MLRIKTQKTILISKLALCFVALFTYAKRASAFEDSNKPPNQTQNPNQSCDTKNESKGSKICIVNGGQKSDDYNYNDHDFYLIFYGGYSSITNYQQTIGATTSPLTFPEGTKLIGNFQGADAGIKALIPFVLNHNLELLIGASINDSYDKGILKLYTGTSTDPTHIGITYNSLMGLGHVGFQLNTNSVLSFLALGNYGYGILDLVTFDPSIDSSNPSNIGLLPTITNHHAYGATVAEFFHLGPHISIGVAGTYNAQSMTFNFGPQYQAFGANSIATFDELNVDFILDYSF